MRRFAITRLRLDPLETREVPAGVRLVALGADQGARPRLQVIECDSGHVRWDFYAFNPAFKGGVRVAVGDVTGDGQDDIIAATGPGVAPIVKVFDGNTGLLVKRFLAVAPAITSPGIPFFSSQAGTRPPTGFAGGVTVAAGDVNGDGRAEVITGADAGAGSRVAVYDGRTGARLGNFLAFESTNRFGVRLATGDLDGDGKAEIIAAPQTGKGNRVRVFDGQTRLPRATFTTPPAPIKGGLYVATGDVDGDGQAEIIVGDGASPHLSILEGSTGTVRRGFDASELPSAGGARVGGGMISVDGQADILVGATDAPEWAAYNGLGGSLQSHDNLLGFATGMWVASSMDQAGINRHASQVVRDWNTAALDAIRAEATPPPKASRALAITQASVFDSVNGIIRGYQHYHVAPATRLGTSVPAAAAQAAYTTLVALFPNQQAQFDALLESSLGAVPDGQSKDDGVAWGQSVAQAILAARANDGSANNPPYTPGTDPGDWQPTPPANAPALLPGWGDVAPFGVGDVASFMPSGPPELTSQEYADEFNEVKQLGSLNSVDRTADQTEIAKFWADGAGTFTPPGHWNAIASDLANADGLSILRTARLFAQLDIADADAAIVCWKTKYTYNFWRPITAIRAANSDGNDQTIQEDLWEPLLTTPPFPEYTSGHSTFSGAASTVLAAYFGADRAFAADSNDLSITRNFASFSQAADEAGQSRIYGGIHFQSANQDGLACGRSIGSYVLANLLQSG
jgi:FG-GAP-like repeat/PAP2 superfamily/FG-GAP repeat